MAYIGCVRWNGPGVFIDLVLEAFEGEVHGFLNCAGDFWHIVRLDT